MAERWGFRPVRQPVDTTFVSAGSLVVNTLDRHPEGPWFNSGTDHPGCDPDPSQGSKMNPPAQQCP